MASRTSNKLLSFVLLAIPHSEDKNPKKVLYTHFIFNAWLIISRETLPILWFASVQQRFWHDWGRRQLAYSNHWDRLL